MTSEREIDLQNEDNPHLKLHTNTNTMYLESIQKIMERWGDSKAN